MQQSAYTGTCYAGIGMYDIPVGFKGMKAFKTNGYIAIDFSGLAGLCC